MIMLMKSSMIMTGVVSLLNIYLAASTGNGAVTIISIMAALFVGIIMLFARSYLKHLTEHKTFVTDEKFEKLRDYIDKKFCLIIKHLGIKE